MDSTKSKRYYKVITMTIRKPKESKPLRDRPSFIMWEHEALAHLPLNR